MTATITPDVTWLYEAHKLGDDRLAHVSAYVVETSEGYVLIDTGSFHDREAIEAGIERVTGDDGLSAIVLTHADLPHSGNLDPLRSTYPGARVICGSSSPDIVGLGESEKSPASGRLSIAGDDFDFLYPPLADIQHSTWIHHPKSGVLFTADGFGNYHRDGETAKTTADMAEVPSVVDIRDFHESALLWLKYVDPPTLVSEITSLFDRHDVTWVAPIHGNPIAAEDREQYLSRLEQAITQISLQAADH